MMSNDVLNIIDKDAYKDAYNIDLPKSQNESITQQLENQKQQEQPETAETNTQPEMEQTFLGKMPKNAHEQIFNPELIKQMLGWAAGGPGMSIAEHAAPGIAEAGIEGIKIAKEKGKEGIEYIKGNPLKKEAEEFRKGQSPAQTSSENIENIARRIQFAKKSGETEALKPKKELYSQEGKSNIYEVGKENLPEGNLPKVAHMIEPGAEFGEAQQSALSRALKDYRKNGKIENFLEKSEDIFGIERLSPKAESKIEDTLLLPTNRESKYFSEANKELIKKYYTDELKELHDEYKSKPILNNYDKLQSELKNEKRNLFKEGKKGDRSARREARSLGKIINDLQHDQQEFTQTLPEKMHNLAKEFSEKWAAGRLNIQAPN